MTDDMSGSFSAARYAINGSYAATWSVLAAASWLVAGCLATATSLAELLNPDGISDSVRAASHATS